jgi:predicted nucleotide-binding protein
MPQRPTSRTLTRSIRVVAHIRPRVFIVHGRDEKNKKTLCKMLRLWGLDPIVLAESRSRKRLLLDKLLDVLGKDRIRYPFAPRFTFVLMTPDDVGGLNSDYDRFLKRINQVTKGRGRWTGRKGESEIRFIEGEEDLQVVADRRDLLALCEQARQIFKARARQNVLFEYGLCVGVLGPERVCMLLGGGLEIPSDLLGYYYTEFKETVSERKCRAEIKRDLESAGYVLSRREREKLRLSELSQLRARQVVNRKRIS